MRYSYDDDGILLFRFKYAPQRSTKQPVRLLKYYLLLLYRLCLESTGLCNIIFFYFPFVCIYIYISSHLGCILNAEEEKLIFEYTFFFFFFKYSFHPSYRHGHTNIQANTTNHHRSNRRNIVFNTDVVGALRRRDSARSRAVFFFILW